MPVLSVAELTSWGALYYAVAVLVDPMHADTGWAPPVVSLAFSVGLLASGLLAPWIGRRVDTSGPRTVMAFGSLIGAAGLILWGSASTLLALFGAWAVIGVGMAATLYEPAFAAVMQFVPYRRHESIVLVSLVGALAATVFQPLTSVLASALGWRQTTWALAVVLLVVTLPLHLSLPPGRPDPPTPGRGPASRSLPVPVRGVALPFAVAHAVAAGVTFNLVVALVANGMTATAAAWWAGTFGIAKVAGRIAVGVLDRHQGAASLSRWTLGVMGVALVLPGVGSATTVLAVHVLLFGASTGALTVLRPLVVAELVVPTSFGTALGTVARTVTLARAGGPPVMAYAATLLGGHANAALVAGAATALVACRIPSPRPDRPRTPTGPRASDTTDPGQTTRGEPSVDP